MFVGVSGLCVRQGCGQGEADPHQLVPAIVGVLVHPQQFGAGCVLCHGCQGASYTDKVSTSWTVVNYW